MCNNRSTICISIIYVHDVLSYSGILFPLWLYLVIGSQPNIEAISATKIYVCSATIYDNKRYSPWINEIIQRYTVYTTTIEFVLYKCMRTQYYCVFETLNTPYQLLSAIFTLSHALQIKILLRSTQHFFVFILCAAHSCPSSHTIHAFGSYLPFGSCSAYIIRLHLFLFINLSVQVFIKNIH